jgi:hypothetical protein
MASDYTDSFAGEPYFIHKGEQLSAAGMNAALNTKEKVANKTDTINNSTAEYPSSKAVYDAIQAVNTDTASINTALTGKQDKIAAGNANDILTKTAVAGTLGTLTKTTTINAALASASDDKIPTEKAVALALQDLVLPVGTILAMSTSSWVNASTEFKRKWHVCDGSDGTPDLRGKFLRGGTSSDATNGGADSVKLAKENLPKHAHTITDKGHKHTESRVGNSQVYTGNVGGLNTSHAVQPISRDTSTDVTNISINENFPDQVVYAQAFSVVPKYYTVIYIMKMA